MDARYLANVENSIEACQVGEDWSVRAGIGRGTIDGHDETLINLNGYRIPPGLATVIKAGDRWLISVSIPLMENGWEPVEMCDG